ncbi:tRNA (adenosine(37)-N6)-threonylcarbamoyltransferase complex ATPase subunit type 1 TsaE [Opitutales bacterium]|nr:tRNA (adenosine(37)-N6)-threonylcarbamoyltransferase complex ATPase subunit type 1 TsaE [Planctomycetota bacterium]MDA8736099.1 tRNA (adenosine(37)-N6)-threonylcarbamoyltransferase complex ATPase subunit type 1 TsaE [Opitutales bacterium]MDB2506533.1 tRNA (adenosine(37)-N6)-threonylcarbamoyltransferase complex ATPase subunit type 1 TsaE [Opitutales bacterium]
MSRAKTDLFEQLSAGIVTTSADQTEALARAFAALVPVDQVLAFHGDLGAGKTTFIRGLARGWQIEEPVTSPTFNLYKLYQGSRQLVHMDAYRLSPGADLDSLMIDDFLTSPWCLAVEWSERIAESLPSDAWHLYLSIDDLNEHRIRLSR